MAPRKFYCCYNQLDDSESMFCNGPAHPKQTRKFHSECVDADDWPVGHAWYCSECTEKYTGLQELEESQSVEEESQDSQASQYEITSIEDLYIDHDVDLGLSIAHFNAMWKGYEDPSGTPFYNVVAADEEATFFKRARFHPPRLPRDNFQSNDALAKNPYWDLFQTGLWCVVDHLTADAREHKLIKKYYAYGGLKEQFFEILASVPMPVIFGICGTGLRARKTRDVDLYAWLEVNRQKSIKRPGIYVLELTDKIGRAPTLQQMRHFVDAARAYMSKGVLVSTDDEDILQTDADFALCVDSIFGELTEEQTAESASGWRKYLHTSTARQSLRTMLDQLEDRLHSLEEGGHGQDEAVPFVLRDVGYSDNARTRIMNHEKVQGTANQLLSIFCAIAQTHKDLAEFSVHGEVIFLGFRDTHASLAEIMFSLLAQTYIETGTGFNSVEAGIQNYSHRAYGVREHRRFRRDTIAESAFSHNMDAEEQKLANLCARKRNIDERIEKLSLQRLQEDIQTRRDILRSFAHLVDSLESAADDDE